MTWGVNWPSLEGVGAGAALATVVLGIMKFLLSKRKQSDGVALELVKAQGARIDRLERAAERKDLIYQLQFRALRHRAGGMAMGMKAFISMVKVAPDKALEFATLAEADFEEREKIYERECAEVDALLAELARGDAAQPAEQGE